MLVILTSLQYLEEFQSRVSSILHIVSCAGRVSLRSKSWNGNHRRMRVHRRHLRPEISDESLLENGRMGVYLKIPCSSIALRSEQCHPPSALPTNSCKDTLAFAFKSKRALLQEEDPFILGGVPLALTRNVVKHQPRKDIILRVEPRRDQIQWYISWFGEGNTGVFVYSGDQTSFRHAGGNIKLRW